MIKAHAGRLRVHELACTFAADAARLARTFQGPGQLERGAQEAITHLRVAGALDPVHHRAISALEDRVVLISKMIGRLHAHPPPVR